MYGDAKKKNMDILCIQGIFVIFQEINYKWYLFVQPPFIILNDHGSHVTLEIVKQA